ncbi:hypothetical protein [Sphingomonas sp.]|uniref:hypothetical protein n=1 Tax=Sphingomonas sp. TaxID=28214 RepID=UPI003BA89D77
MTHVDEALPEGMVPSDGMAARAVMGEMGCGSQFYLILKDAFRLHRVTTEAALATPSPAPSDTLREARRKYAAEVEGDSDNPLRVAKANAIMRGEHDDEIAIDREPDPAHMTDTMEQREAIDDLVAMLSAITVEEGCTIFEHTAEEVGVAVLENHHAILAALTTSPRIEQGEERAREAAEYVIRKGGYYYRPNAQGYTPSVHEAGRYTLADAISLTHPNGPDGPRDGLSYMPAPAALATEASAYPRKLEAIVEPARQLLIVAQMTTFSDRYPQQCHELEEALSRLTGGE